MARRERPSYGERMTRGLSMLTGWKGRVLVAVIVFLVAGRLALPTLLKSYVNRTLSQIPEYRGEVGDITVNLWRGSYQIKDLTLVKTTEDVPVPFFSARNVDLAVQWKALWRGHVVGEIVLDEPELNFVQAPTASEKDAPTAAGTQTGIDKSWMQRVKELFPLKINQFEIRRGEIHFRNFNSKPPVDIYLHDVYAVALNLATRPELGRAPATITGGAQALGDGYLRVWLTVDPFAEQPTFNLDVMLEEVQMPALNDFFEAYANVDAEAGQFSMYSSFVSTNGVFRGNVKPIFKDLKILGVKDVKQKSILHSLWEALVAAATEVFKNQPKNRVATEIPLSGRFDDPDPDLWATIGGLLHNAYIQAIVPGLTEPIKIPPAVSPAATSPIQ